jgi:adenosylcobyric acid synthase (glutamine-hydrolysing) (EC 6.3.5.10)
MVWTFKLRENGGTDSVDHERLREVYPGLSSGEGVRGVSLQGSEHVAQQLPYEGWRGDSVYPGLSAMAAGREPERGMNAVLLKPSGDDRVEVVVYGTPLGTFSYGEYYEKVVPKVKESLS